MNTKREKHELILKARAITESAESEGREPTSEERKKFDKIFDEIRAIDLNIEEAKDSPGPVLGLQRADGPFDCSAAKPGELRFVRNTEKLSDVFPCQDRKLDNFSLGKYIGLACGEDVPDSEIERRQLSTHTDASGGLLIPEVISREIWDLARNKSRVIKAGATMLEMPSLKFLVPKLTKDVTGSWKVENESASDDSVTFGALELQARTMFFWLPISRELWQDAGRLDVTLRNSFAEAAALKLDYAALMGTGAGEEPRGLYYDSSVTQTGVTGVCYDDLSDALYRIENSNLESNGVIMSPRSMNHLRKLKDGQGEYMAIPKWMPPIFVTKQVPDDMGGGSDESVVFTGEFSNLLIGIRSKFQIEILKEVKAQKHQIVLMGTMRLDVAAIRPAAFDITTGVKSMWTS